MRLSGALGTRRTAGRRPAHRHALWGCLATAALGQLWVAPAAVSRSGVAHAASTIALNDTGRLRLTSHHGFTLNEEGSASGTISGKIYIHLKVVSTNRVTAEVNLYPNGGSVTGYATAGYHPSGALATFSGTMAVQRGSGRYGHAHGSGLSFTGTIQRSSDAVTVHVNGRFST
jgi:hypothetical protein